MSGTERGGRIVLHSARAYLATASGTDQECTLLPERAYSLRHPQHGSVPAPVAPYDCSYAPPLRQYSSSSDNVAITCSNVRLHATAAGPVWWYATSGTELLRMMLRAGTARAHGAARRQRGDNVP
eukprot:2229340-Rhodomonas_salina.1